MAKSGTNGDGLSDAGLLKAEADTRALFAKLEAHLPSKGHLWTFDTPGPNIFDGTVIPFIARLQDTYRDYLIPEAVARYAEPHLKDAVWQRIVQGKSTWKLRDIGVAKSPAPRAKNIA